MALEVIQEDVCHDPNVSGPLEEVVQGLEASFRDRINRVVMHGGAAR